MKIAGKRPLGEVCRENVRTSESILHFATKRRQLHQASHRLGVTGEPGHLIAHMAGAFNSIRLRDTDCRADQSVQ